MEFEDGPSLPAEPQRHTQTIARCRTQLALQMYVRTRSTAWLVGILLATVLRPPAGHTHGVEVGGSSLGVRSGVGVEAGVKLRVQAFSPLS